MHENTVDELGDSYTIANDFADDSHLGIRIYDVVGGVETEQDATATAHAIINCPHAAVEVDAMYTPPAHDYTLLRVKLYKNEHGAGWAIVSGAIGNAVFDWADKGAFSLDAVQWTVHYNMASAGVLGDYFRFGVDHNVNYDSRIEGVTEAAGVLPLVVGAGVLGVSVIG